MGHFLVFVIWWLIAKLTPEEEYDRLIKAELDEILEDYELQEI